jgi:hypothetical protein
VRDVERLQWDLGHGNVFKALQVVPSVEMDLDAAVATGGHDTARHRRKAVAALHTDSANTQGFISHDGQRDRAGERSSPGVGESTGNQVIRKRFGTKQPMAGTQRGAPLLLQIRPRVLKGDGEATVREWDPGCRVSTQPAA